MVDVDLDDLGLAFELVGERDDLGLHGFAGAAPVRIKVDEHGLLAAQHLALEVTFLDDRNRHGAVDTGL